MAKNLEISFLLDFYGDMLTSKQREAVENYYNDDLSLSEIASNQGITRQGVRDAIKRSEMIMQDMEERLGLVKKFNKMKNGLEVILDQSKNIQKCNSRAIFSKEIQDSASMIENIANDIINQI